MEAISQIIRSVGLFVSSSPEVTISTKNQPFLYLLKNGLIEVRDFVYSLPNCWEMLSVCCVTDFVMKYNSLSWKTIFIHLYFRKWPYFSIAYARNFGKVTSLTVYDPLLCMQNQTSTTFWQQPPSMEAMSQIIWSVGLFVSSSPEVTISTKNQPFLYLLKKWLDRSTRFWLFFTKLVGDVLGMSCNWFCDET